MNTTTYQVLFDGKANENASSAKWPVALYVPGSVNLEETVTQCLSHDNDMLVDARRYEVKTVTLPTWLSFEEWKANRIAWDFLWADARTMELEEGFQRGLLHFQGSLRFACVTLLSTKNFRSDFRSSLRNQLVNWMTTPATERVYASPFSPKQQAALVNVRDSRAAHNLSNRKYYESRYRENTGLPVAA